MKVIMSAPTNNYVVIGSKGVNVGSKTPNACGVKYPAGKVTVTPMAKTNLGTIIASIIYSSRPILQCLQYLFSTGYCLKLSVKDPVRKLNYLLPEM